MRLIYLEIDDIYLERDKLVSENIIYIDLLSNISFLFKFLLL